MRQETVTRNIYKFDELPKETRLKIVESWRHDDEFHSHYELRNSLERFCEAFPIQVNDWQVGAWGNSYVKSEYTGGVDPETTGAELIAIVKANESLLAGNCPFTGVCYDENLIDPLRAYLKNPDDSTLYELLQACLSSWLDAYRADLDYWYSFESVRDDINANEIEFYDCGGIV